METAMINEVRDTFAPRNWHPFGKILASDVPEAFALNPQFGRTPATQNFCQLLSFGCEFLKFDSISCFVFLWDVYRVSLDPVILSGPAALH
jgi:hypothetical protein